LYVLRGNDLFILDARPASGMQLVSQTLLTDYPQAMFLHGNRLTVITQRYDYNQDHSPEVHVTTYDISNRAQPSVHRQMVLEGIYIDSRHVDDQLVFVVRNGFSLPPPRLIPDADEGEPSGASPTN